MKRGSMTVSLARWSATHPWRALLLWVAFVVAAVMTASAVSTQSTTQADYRVGESGRAAQIVADHELGEPLTESVLVTAADGAELTDSEVQPVLRQVRDGVDELSGVAGVGTVLWSEDRTAVLVPVQMSGTGPDADEHIDPLLAATSALAEDHPALAIEQVGGASLDAGINDQVSDDLAAAEKLSLPVTLLILLLAFGALIAAGIPLLLALSAVAATIGIYAPVSFLVPSEDTVSSMILLIGMAVGVDYSLFYLKREREERRRGLDTVDAIEAAAATSGRSVVVAGFAVIVSMAGLYVMQDATFSSLATGAIIVVAVAVLGSLTVLPAALAKLGRWVDRPRVPLLWRVNRRIGSAGISRRLLRPVMRFPKASLIVASGAVLALAAPASSLHLEQASDATLPRSIAAVRALDTLQEKFPSEGASFDVVVSTTPDRLDDAIRSLESLARAARTDAALVPAAEPAVRTATDRRAAVLSLAGPYGAGSEQSTEALAALRSQLVPAETEGLRETTIAVGGSTAENADFTSQQSDRLPWVIAVVLTLTMLMMLLTFRSLVIALLTTVLNLMSVGAAFGVLVLVFQHGWFASALGVQETGLVVSWIPLFMLVVLVGLSMDYHVFVLSRIREGVQGGLPPRVAVEFGVNETAGAVTSAAAVMVSVFAVFATLSMVEMQQIGVGLAVGVLLDATLIRVVILPAALNALGDRAWSARALRQSGHDSRPTGPTATQQPADAAR